MLFIDALIDLPDYKNTSYLGQSEMLQFNDLEIIYCSLSKLWK